jgi:hypothetical protein
MVDTALVLKLLKPIWAQKHEKARRQVRGSRLCWIGRKRTHHRKGQNPAAGKVNFDQILDKTSNICIVEPSPSDPS